MVLTWLLLTLTAAAEGAAPNAAPNAAPSLALAKSKLGRAPVIAFVNVSVIPMDHEQVLTGQTVLVRGTTIAEIGPAAQVAVPAGATRVDGQGKFLIPGLGDMHMHL